MNYILYNPCCNNGAGLTAAKALKEKRGIDCEVVDATEISYKEFLTGKTVEDNVYIVGGDGTLSRLINDLDGYVPTAKLLYYAAGSGNDFFNDINFGKEEKSEIILLNDYIVDLPKVTVNGMTKRFINGIGFGVDGMCCQVGDDLRSKGVKKINYTAIAIKQLLFWFKKKRAIVTVDGQSFEYKNVWIAPTMKGRFYGGGMIVAPAQDRLSKDKEVTSVMFMGKFRIPTLIIFPSIFKGKHIEHKKNVAVHSGKKITVTFNAPTALQIDGETVREVLSYSVEV